MTYTHEHGFIPIIKQHLYKCLGYIKGKGDFSVQIYTSLMLLNSLNFL